MVVLLNFKVTLKEPGPLLFFCFLLYSLTVKIQTICHSVTMLSFYEINVLELLDILSGPVSTCRVDA